MYTFVSIYIGAYYRDMNKKEARNTTVIESEYRFARSQFMGSYYKRYFVSVPNTLEYKKRSNVFEN